MSLKILLADDSLTAQNMGKKILTDAGYEVVAVSNGAQAIKKIVSDHPDLVVLDVYMPGYSGVELCERMRNTRETASIPVVLSVGKMEAFKPEESKRVRADGLIVKPFEATELLALVKRLEEKVAAAPRRPKAVTQAPEPEQADVQAEMEASAASKVEVSSEAALMPAAGMDLITEEAQPEQPDSGTPIEFEVERAVAPPVEEPEGPRMTAAAGFSGVFEMEPSSAKPAPPPVVEPAPTEAFERFSVPEQAPPADVPQAGDSSEAHPGLTLEHKFSHEGAETVALHPDYPSTSMPGLEVFHGKVEAGHQSEPAQADAQPPAEESNHGNGAAMMSEASETLPEVSALPELMSSEPAAPSSEAVPVVDPIATVRQVSYEPPTWGPSPSVFAPGDSAWIAEEAAVEPHESAVPLHEEMKQALGSAAALDAIGPEAMVAGYPQARSPYQEMAGDELPRQAGADLAELDSAIQEVLASAPSAASPVELPEQPAAARHEEATAHESQPRVTEVTPDPSRIANIVEQVMDRLKPEVIAAVTRELERNRNR